MPLPGQNAIEIANPAARDAAKDADFERRIAALERKLAVVSTATTATNTANAASFTPGGFTASATGAWAASPYPSNPAGGSGVSFSVAVAGTYLITWNATCYATAVQNSYIDIWIDSVYKGNVRIFNNQTSVHTTLSGNAFTTTLSAGTHRWFIGQSPGVGSDSNDWAFIAGARIG